MHIPDSPHAETAERVREALATTDRGLTDPEAAERLALFGPNRLREEKTNLAVLFLRQFNNILVFILMAAAVIAYLVADVKDAAIIVFIIFVNGILGFVQELKAEASLEALKKLTESQVRVVRDGTVQVIPSSQLVPGDRVLLSEGDLVTADIRLSGTQSLLVDESLLTGESFPVEKDADEVLSAETAPYDLANMVLSGTTVVRGTGEGYVVKTGSRTYLGSIAEKAQEQSRDSPFTRAIRTFSQRYLVILLVILAFIGTVAYLQGRGIFQIAYLLVAQLVSAVPEGLPIVVTLVLVVGAVALSRKKTLVRHLPAVETMGSATIIASDKTGTITRGRVAVHHVHALDRDALTLAAALCNDARDGMGDPIDLALAEWVEGFSSLQAVHHRSWTHPFDTATRFMATANRVGDFDLFFIKGAWEALRVHAENVEDLPGLEEEVDRMAGMGLRVLAFGAGPRTGEDPSGWHYRITGLVGFLDPAKEGAGDAVQVAKKAGIRVMMITGDHPLTAREIARSVHIWTEGDRVLTGTELEGMDDETLSRALQETTVLARILPEHKYRVVRVLQQHGEIVAVTGDGVNDVPALRAADLGIAMGSGTEAAKNASKMVILDSDLTVIVDAIRNARVTVQNIRKVIYYLVSTSVSEITLIGSSVVAGLPLPLLPIQILWINLVTDGVQDKTFPFIKEEGDVMSLRPKEPARQFFDAHQIRRILIFALIIGFTSTLLFIHLLGRYPYQVAVSILFTSFVCFQWFNGIQAQKEREPFFRNVRRSLTINPLIFLSVGIGLALQLAAVYLVPEWFGVVPLSADQWIYPLALSLLAFFVVEAIKWIEWRRRGAQSASSGSEG